MKERKNTQWVARIDSWSPENITRIPVSRLECKFHSVTSMRPRASLYAFEDVIPRESVSGPFISCTISFQEPGRPRDPEFHVAGVRATIHRFGKNCSLNGRPRSTELKRDCRAQVRMWESRGKELVVVSRWLYPAFESEERNPRFAYESERDGRTASEPRITFVRFDSILLRKCLDF